MARVAADAPEPPERAAENGAPVVHGRVMKLAAAALALLLCAMPGGRAMARGPVIPSPTYRLLARDIIINADLWSSRPEILSAGYGFDGIVGVDGGEPGARYVTRVEVVADATPLMLVGPDGPVSAVGLFKDSGSSPYQSGPYLVGAKLNRLSTEGEGGPLFLSSNLPNDGRR